MTWPVFFLTPTDKVELSLRRYVVSKTDLCAGPRGYHNASTLIGVVESRRPTSGYERATESPFEFQEDPRWPTQCEACPRPFAENDYRQVNQERLHSGHPSGELYTFHSAPIGAMWDAYWMSGWKGPDGICLVVKTPGGDWMVDGPCSNCTRVGEPHLCWPRKGDPRQNQVDVRKIHGDTCSAGAGSIIIGGWHGFLEDNFLRL